MVTPSLLEQKGCNIAHITLAVKIVDKEKGVEFEHGKFKVIKYGRAIIYMSMYMRQLSF